MPTLIKSVIGFNPQGTLLALGDDSIVYAWNWTTGAWGIWKQ